MTKPVSCGSARDSVSPGQRNVVEETASVPRLTTHHIIAFKDLLALSAVYADELKKLGLVRDLYSLNRTKGLWLDKQDAPSEGQLPIISILAPTGPDFLVAWIACIGLGYGVVFIA